jgi:hypothetical protein
VGDRVVEDGLYFLEVVVDARVGDTHDPLVVAATFNLTVTSS